MSHIVKGVYQVVGHFPEGWLTVKPIGRINEEPEMTPPPGGKIIALWNDLQIDRVPIEMVAFEDRMPNTLLRVTVRDRTAVIHVERENAA